MAVFWLCSWDASCTETEEWQEDAGVNKLEMGGNQPFYQVLIDWKDAYGGFGIFSQQNLIAYVAQDMLSVPEVRLPELRDPSYICQICIVTSWWRIFYSKMQSGCFHSL